MSWKSKLVLGILTALAMLLLSLPCPGESRFCEMRRRHSFRLRLGYGRFSSCSS